MLNTLCDYFLLKEVVKVTDKPTNHYLCNHKEKIMVLRHARYIHRDCIEYRYRKNLTDLYNMIPLKEFAEHITLPRGPLEDRYEFMRKNNNMIYFDYTEVENIIYIAIDEELKHLLKKYTPFIVSTKEDYKKDDIVAYYHFAGFYIGFWK